MEHPLIPNLDDLTMDQLQERIAELTRKVGMAHRMGNAQLRHQVQMALDTYQTKYRERLMAPKKDDNTPDFGGKIDIT
jgi:hypothetical protein